MSAITEVRKLVKDSPELGAYRVRAALEQIGIPLSQATCGRLLAHNRKLYGLPPAKGGAPHVRKEMPYKAHFRHEYWSREVAPPARAPLSISWESHRRVKGCKSNHEDFIVSIARLSKPNSR
jgi:hypothetical protein